MSFRLYFGFNGKVSRTQFIIGLSSQLCLLILTQLTLIYMNNRLIFSLPHYSLEIRLIMWIMASLGHYYFLMMLLHLMIQRARDCHHFIIIPIILFLPWLTLLGFWHYYPYLYRTNPGYLLYFLLFDVLFESKIVGCFGSISLGYLIYLLLKRGDFSAENRIIV